MSNVLNIPLVTAASVIRFSFSTLFATIFFSFRRFVLLVVSFMPIWIARLSGRRLCQPNRLSKRGFSFFLENLKLIETYENRSQKQHKNKKKLHCCREQWKAQPQTQFNDSGHFYSEKQSDEHQFSQSAKFLIIDFWIQAFNVQNRFKFQKTSPVSIYPRKAASSY